ncbi:MAG TPA: DUF4357 domain-containing protein [bacterium]|nr:DUF4357 domain-containing protein [bacterium]
MFLIHGDPKRLRTAELSNWTGKAVAGPRSEFEGVFFASQDHFLFTRDAEFSSPSAAASVVHGGHANGLIAWKNQEGKTLKEIEAS